MTGFGFGADRLGWTDDALAELARLRGWTEAAIERLELTYDASSGVVGIPIRDMLDELGTISYLPWPDRRGNGRAKIWQPAGVPRQLFPPPELLPDDTRDVLVLEGEPDVIAAWSAGLVAVGVPGTAGWNADYAARFRGPRWRVSVAFDCDDVGRRAGAEVALSLAEAGVEVRLIDLDPSRRDGYDVTDFLLERGREAGAAELLGLVNAAKLYTGEAPAVPVVIEPLRAFLERALPPAESLVGVARGGTNLLPRYGWVLPWGREGSGKTSVIVDLLFHVAAGLAWLKYAVARPLRVVAVVNEGVPGGLQDKLAQKLELWDGDRDAVLDNLAIYASPWGAFTFRDAALVAHLRDYATDFGADYVALDPLHTLGTIGAGSPQDTEAFKNELRAFGLWENVGVITAHHSNKMGMVSGDWARHADTVLHLEKDGKNPATKITLEKARPADPAELGVAAILEWVVETMSYRRVVPEAPAPLDEAEALGAILERLSSDTPTALEPLLDGIKGTKTALRELVIRAIAEGVIVNLAPPKARPEGRQTYKLVRNNVESATAPTLFEDDAEQTGMVEPNANVGEGSTLADVPENAPLGDELTSNVGPLVRGTTFSTLVGPAEDDGDLTDETNDERELEEEDPWT